MAKARVFRFGVLAALLLIFPFPIGRLPFTWELAEWLSRPWEWLVDWFSRAVLGIPSPPHMFTGSGDTTWHYVQLLLIVILACLGTAIWTVVDRRRGITEYPRLAAAMQVLLRYYLAATMFAYGAAKVLPLQFPPPWVGRYDGAIGDMSPMGLLWTFMGQSSTYTFIAGLAEIIGAVLLFWRRTTLLGALLLAGVLVNIVLLNFCYDVPVKLFSSELLLMTFALIYPHRWRLLGALLGYGAAPIPSRPRISFLGERMRGIAKYSFITSTILTLVFVAGFERRLRAPRSALHGVWTVETFVLDGIEHPPLLTDDVRWRKLIVAEHAIQIRFTTDRRQLYRTAKVDDAAKTVRIGARVLAYQLTGDRLVLADDALRVVLVREAEPLLKTRGFHWIQEFPFNR